MKFNRYIVSTVLVASVLTSLFIILCAELTQKDVSYSYGKVIQTGLSNGTIEVQIEETGPRIFVSDLGSYRQSDFKYNDIVDLEFYDRHYHITHIRN